MSIRHSRLVVYLPEDLHRQLKAKLAMKGQTISAWVRERAAKAIRATP
jgi:hypothetical protein